MDRPVRLWGHVGRFTLVHVLVYLLIAFPFGLIQDLLPAANRVALEFFRPYGLELPLIIGQALRGLLLALILYPFYDRLVSYSRGRWVLFGLLWGLSVLGSVEPIPGSIEGVLYTVTTLPEHLLTLAAAAVQTLIFCLVYGAWETRAASPPAPAPPFPAVRLRGFALRFTLLHVISYMLVGIVFMTVQDYGDAFATQSQFALFRPLDDPMMAAVLPAQVVRGALFAWLLYPLYGVFMARRRSWLLLFGLMFGLTALGSALFFPEIVGMIAAGDSLLRLVVGLPEIFVQMLLFAWAVTLWERRILQRGA